jgi:hypothetical protein
MLAELLKQLPPSTHVPILVGVVATLSCKLAIFATLAPIIHQAILLLCGWQSFKALETERSDDDTQWLTFWFIHTIMLFARGILDWVAFIIPFYHEGFLCLTMYLAFFGGATHAYSLLRPLLKEHEQAMDEHVARVASMASEGMEQVASAAKVFGEELDDCVVKDAMELAATRLQAIARGRSGRTEALHRREDAAAARDKAEAEAAKVAEAEARAAAEGTADAASSSKPRRFFSWRKRP